MAIDKITINGARCEYVDRPAAFLPVSITDNAPLVPFYESSSPIEFTVGYYEDGGMYYTDYVNIYDVTELTNISGIALRTRDKSGSFISSSFSNAETCVFYATLNERGRAVLNVEHLSSLQFSAPVAVYTPVSYVVTDFTDNVATFRSSTVRKVYADIRGFSDVLSQPVITQGSNNNYIVTPAISRAELKLSIPTSGSFKRYNFLTMFAEPKLGTVAYPSLTEQATSFTTVITAQTYLL